MRIAGFNISKYRQDDNEARDAMMFAEAPTRARGIVEPTDADLELINKLCSKPLTASDIYVFESVISTNALDSYNTRMTESSLRNYVDDVNAGNPLMTGHRWGSLPIGRSFSGRLEVIDDLECVIVRDYMLRNYEIGDNKTDTIARGIEAGTLTDMSVGFGGNTCRYVCSICGHDIWSEKCFHVPGIEYDGERAFAWVEDAHLVEHSIVYSGATPGAVIRKARSMAEAGKISPAEITRLEETWRCRLLDSSKMISLPPDKNGRKENVTMNARQLLAKLRSALTPDMAQLFGLRFDQIGSGLSDDTPAESIVSQIIDVFRSAVADAVEAAMKPLRDAGFTTIDEFKALKERAALGDKYRSDLVEDALAEGVRAYGDKFDRDRYTRMFATCGIDDIKAFRSEFTEAAKQRLGTGGRQTPAGDPNAAPRGAQMTDEELDKRAKSFGR